MIILGSGVVQRHPLVYTSRLGPEKEEKFRMGTTNTLTSVPEWCKSLFTWDVEFKVCAGDIK